MRLSFFFEIEGNVTECLFLIVLLPESALNRNMAQPDLKPHNTICYWFKIWIIPEYWRAKSKSIYLSNID